MAKTKDGFYKQSASGIGSDALILLAGGGTKALSELASSSNLSNYYTKTESDKKYAKGNNIKYDKFTTASTASDGWYNIFTCTDNTNSPCIVNVRAYAHSSMIFTVTKGWATSGNISILEYNSSSNASYAYVKGARILSDGKVQINLHTGSNVNVEITVVSTGNVTLSSTLVCDTTAYSSSTSVTVLDSKLGTDKTMFIDDLSVSNTVTANRFTGNLNNTLTFSTGAFSAKTYNNSAAVTVNIPTHTSHLTNNSGFLTSLPSHTHSYASIGTVAFTPANEELTAADVLAKTGNWSIKKGTWDYSGNGYIKAGDFGNIDLAGTSILTFGSSSAYTQLYITAPTQSGHSGKTNEIFFYNNHGSDYSPGWTRVLTNRNYIDYVNTTNFPGLNKTGTVTQVKIGSTAYNPSSGIVSLPAYPTIPTVTDYYWANVKVSSTSNTATQPTFSKWTASNHCNITNSTGGKDLGVEITGKTYGIAFMIGSGDVNRGIYDRTNNKWMFYADASNYYMNNTLVTLAVRPSTNNSYTLGTSSVRWSTVYSVYGNFTGDVTLYKSDNGDSPHLVF